MIERFRPILQPTPPQREDMMSRRQRRWAEEERQRAEKERQQKAEEQRRLDEYERRFAAAYAVFERMFEYEYFTNGDVARQAITDVLADIVAGGPWTDTLNAARAAFNLQQLEHDAEAKADQTPPKG